MTHSHAMARLFVAIDPPKDVRERLAGWARTALRSAGGRPGAGHPLRVLDPELLHVTLCFLGNQPLEEVGTIDSRLGEVASHVGELSVGAPLWLPPRRPRAVAVELHDDGSDRLAELHRRLVVALGELGEVSGGGAGARRHRFRPHVTVARMRDGAAPRERTLTPTPPLSFTPRELVLYRSWLSPEGASYEALRRLPL
ncbi:MAG: RNA 2',3'-cyclic phosphodiesterase [Solirubrobacteraceae bacterium]